ncbi:transposase [Paraburkholderia youngii]
MTTTFGLDLAKRVFQVHWVDMETGEVKRRQLRRDQLVTFFAKQAPALIAMEACGSAHYWARHFVSFGHQVRLIAASFVRPFVKRNKTDVADAQAIWEAAQRPEMRFVAVKSETQQSVLTLHRVREQMVKMRQMQVNQIHGLLYEFGVAAHAGRQGMVDAVRALSELADTLPAMVVDTLREQFQRIDALARDIAALERTLAWRRGSVRTMPPNDSCRSLALGCSRQRLPLPRSATHTHFGQDANLRRFSVWYPGRAVPAGGSNYLASANRATSICARC